MNPFGCVKDRSAWSSLRDLEERDELGNGGGMVEPTSANTGISLVDLLQAWGYRLLAIEPNNVPREKKLLLKIAGAELEIISDGLCLAPRLGDGPINLATTYAEARSYKYVIPNPYENEKNIEAHFKSKCQRDGIVFKAARLFAGAFDARICLLHIHVLDKLPNHQTPAQSLRLSFD